MVAHVPKTRSWAQLPAHRLSLSFQWVIALSSPPCTHCFLIFLEPDTTHVPAHGASITNTGGRTQPERPSLHSAGPRRRPVSIQMNNCGQVTGPRFQSPEDAHPFWPLASVQDGSRRRHEGEPVLGDPAGPRDVPEDWHLEPRARATHRHA